MSLEVIQLDERGQQRGQCSQNDCYFDFLSLYALLLVQSQACAELLSSKYSEAPCLCRIQHYVATATQPFRKALSECGEYASLPRVQL